MQNKDLKNLAKSTMIFHVRCLWVNQVSEGGMF